MGTLAEQKVILEKRLRECDGEWFFGRYFVFRDSSLSWRSGLGFVSSVILCHLLHDMNSLSSLFVQLFLIPHHTSS